MRNRNLVLTAALAAGVTLLPTLAASSTLQQQVIEGSWTGNFSAGDDERAGHLQITRWDEEDRWRSSLELPDATIRLVERQLDQRDGEVEFSLTRAAGTFEMEGRIRRQRGSGTFIFTEDRTFRASMAELGFRRLDDDQVFGDCILDAATCMTIPWGRNIMQVHM